MKRIIAGLALLALAGCSQATQDRPAEAGGKNPDATAPATAVTVYLNADDVPNVALFCVGPWRFASTLSGSDRGNDKASALLRLPEGDKDCSGGVPK